jgi:hypothetical protein
MDRHATNLVGCSKYHCRLDRNSTRRRELAAIILAEELDADLLLMDDLEGRSEAERRHLKVIGTLGALRDAESQQLIDLPQVLDQLRQTNFFISPAVLQSLLAGFKKPETWSTRSRIVPLSPLISSGGLPVGSGSESITIVVSPNDLDYRRASNLGSRTFLDRFSLRKCSSSLWGREGRSGCDFGRTRLQKSAGVFTASVRRHHSKGNYSGHTQRRVAVSDRD